MVYDVTMLKAFYASYKGKMEHVRAILQRPLTLAEKILYTHLFDEKGVKDYKRGEDYVNFRPDRVAMQDATAQMALLQFMNAGREQVAVPSTVHCDHLIQAYRGAREDIATATKTNEEVYDFLRDVSSRYGIGFWQPGAGIGKLCLPWWNDGRYGFAYAQCRWSGYGCHRRWWCRCSRCDDWYGMGIENAPLDWCTSKR